MITEILDNAETQGKNAGAFLREYLPKARVYIEYQNARGLIKDGLATILNSFIDELISSTSNSQGNEGQASKGGSGGNVQVDLRRRIRNFRLFLDSLAVIAKLTKKEKGRRKNEKREV